MIKKRLSQIKKYCIGIKFYEELRKYRFRNKRNDVRFHIKDNFVPVVLKIDEGYQVAWYLGTTVYDLEGLYSSFILKCQFTIKQLASFATIYIR